MSEGDQFVWPGYDLRRIRNQDRYDYGFLPPRFFATVMAAFGEWHRQKKVSVIGRE